MKTKDERFWRSYVQNGFGLTMEVWVDQLTGVNYLFRRDGYAGGLTPLLDREGHPVVTPHIETRRPYPGEEE